MGCPCGERDLCHADFQIGLGLPSISVQRERVPVIALDLEFRHAMVCAFFRLTIDRRRSGV